MNTNKYRSKMQGEKDLRAPLVSNEAPAPLVVRDKKLMAFLTLNDLEDLSVCGSQLLPRSLFFLSNRST